MSTTPPAASPGRDQVPAKARRAARERLRLGGMPPSPEKRGPKPLLVAIGLHLVVGLALLRLVSLGHGLYDWFGLAPTTEKIEEHVTYVETPKPTPPPVPVAKPRPVEPTVTQPPSGVPSVTPTAPDQPSTPPSSRGGDSTGGGGIRGSNIDPNLRGITPGNGDPRVWRAPREVVGVPRDRAEAIDSVIGSVFRAAVDSLDSLNRANATPSSVADWTRRDKNGDKWGWDGAGIRLGKVVIPNALLGLLPLNAQMAMSSNPTANANGRRLAYAREEILRNSTRTIGEADFRKSIKEQRERREREHQQKTKPPDDTRTSAPPRSDEHNDHHNDEQK